MLLRSLLVLLIRRSNDLSRKDLPELQLRSHGDSWHIVNTYS